MERISSQGTRSVKECMKAEPTKRFIIRCFTDRKVEWDSRFHNIWENRKNMLKGKKKFLSTKRDEKIKMGKKSFHLSWAKHTCIGG